MLKKILFALLWCTAVLAGQDAGLIKINPAQREIVILKPEKSTVGINLAAEDLAYHLGAATGVTPKIITDAAIIGKAFVISLGETELAAAAGISGKGMKHNQAQVDASADHLIIAGKEGQGNIANLLVNTSAALFTVYDILEKYNGVRWLWPGKSGEVIPKSPYFCFKGGRYICKTKLKFFFWRQYWGEKSLWTSKEDYACFMNAELQWLLRHRSNRDISEQHYPHGFEKWPAKYLKTHPEYFNQLPDGTRRVSPVGIWGGQEHLISMCIASPAFQRQVVQDWLENFNPDLPRINLKGNDSNLQCVCDYCLTADRAAETNEVRRARAAELFRKGDPKWYESLGSMRNRTTAFYLGVMREADRIAPEKHAKFSGLAYANSSEAPKVKLGSRFQFSFCPQMYFPWTRAKVDNYKRLWQDWYQTGADLVMRPNFTLDGHCYPINYAREFREIFNFAESRSLTGSDYDSLTGMYSAQSLTLYTIARLQNSEPGLTYEEIEREYCSAFGAAAGTIKKYFDKTAEISRSSKEVKDSGRPEGGGWTHYFLYGHDLFTAARFAELKAILDTAAAQVKDDTAVAERVKFLQIGLEHARLTAQAAQAYDNFRTDKDYNALAKAFHALDKFRADNGQSCAFNTAFCVLRESLIWPRGLVKMMAGNAEVLPIDWHFKTDPDKTGVAKGWHTPGFDESGWEKIPTDKPWDKSGYADYDGYGWYRLRITLPKKMPGAPVLVVGSADEAAVVWVNGKKLLDRPYPYEGNTNSWNEAFDVDFSSAALPGQENVIVIRVEDNNGQGGLTKACLLKYAEKIDASASRVNNPQFANSGRGWTKRNLYGQAKIDFLRFDGKDAVRFTPVKSGTGNRKLGIESAVIQDCTGLIPGKKYRLCVKFKTDEKFNGTTAVYLHAGLTTKDKESTLHLAFSGTMTQWSTLSKEFIARKTTCALYLNYFADRGTLYYAEPVIIPAEETPETGSAPIQVGANAVNNPRFANSGRGWTKRNLYGQAKIDFLRFDGKDAVRFTPVKSGTGNRKLGIESAVIQDCTGLIPGKKYRVTVSFKTDENFNGTTAVYLHAGLTAKDKESTLHLAASGVKTQWSTLSKEFIARKTTCALYLNYFADKGTLYYAEPVIIPVEE